MDFVTLLRRDHEKLSSIFQNIQRGFDQADTPERHQLFRQLKRELELHAAVEDLQVYRVFQQSESTRDDAHEALEAHGKIKTLLDQLEISPAYDHKWVAQFQELQKACRGTCGCRGKRDVSQDRGDNDAARSRRAWC